MTCFQVSEPFTGHRLSLVGLGCSLTEQKQCLAPAITRRNPLFSQGDGCSYCENTPELCLKYITLVNLKRLTFLSVTDFENLKKKKKKDNGILNNLRVDYNFLFRPFCIDQLFQFLLKNLDNVLEISEELLNLPTLWLPFQI